MMADYCTLEEIKSELSIAEEAYDDILRGMIGQVKGFIDNLCNRSFDTVTKTTKYFDGADSFLLIDDLLSIDTDGLLLDQDGDGTYEETMDDDTDYILYPLNETPKTWIGLSDQSDYGNFADGVKKGIKITGTWGYADEVPSPIRRASIMQVCRWFKRRESGYATVIGSPELGEVKIYHGLDPDVQLILQPYKRVIF